MVAELNEQDEAGSGATTKLEALPPPASQPGLSFQQKGATTFGYNSDRGPPRKAGTRGGTDQQEAGKS